MKSMRGVVVLAVLAIGMLIPSSVFADVAVEETPSGGQKTARTAPTVKCEPIKGNPELEKAAKEKPPPEAPPGAPPLEKKSASEGSCPSGTLGVTQPETHARHSTSPPPVGAENMFAAPFAAASSAAEGYYYVGDIWWPPAKKPWVGLTYKTEFSDPVVPPNAEFEAHSISQLSVGGGGSGQYSFELGWIKELKDQEEGYKGARPFFFVNPDKYGPLSCYDCGLILAEGAKEPFHSHYYASDGSPESRDVNGNSPATFVVVFAVKQYKGAWWIYFNSEWVGRVSDENWGKHFTKVKEAQVYGEVADTPNAPVTPMGNGNKGGCTCAAGAYAAIVGVKSEKASEGPIWTQVKFHDPLENVSWPQRYTAGNFSSERTFYHFGG